MRPSARMWMPFFLYQRNRSSKSGMSLNDFCPVRRLFANDFLNALGAVQGVLYNRGMEGGLAL